MRFDAGAFGDESARRLKWPGQGFRRYFWRAADTGCYADRVVESGVWSLSSVSKLVSGSFWFGKKEDVIEITCYFFSLKGLRVVL